jgi:CubicO group peptidase (beta-lactamase class C family)
MPSAPPSRLVAADTTRGQRTPRSIQVGGRRGAMRASTLPLATDIAPRPPDDGDPVSDSPSLSRMVDAVVDGALAIGRVVGVVVLIRADGVPIYTRAAGHADREAGTPTAIDTVFRIASLTKPMVAATALGLVERDGLGLDEKVTTYLPDFRPRLEDGHRADITVRHLLTHTAGFGYPEAPSDPPTADRRVPVDRYWAAHVSDGLDQPGLRTFLPRNIRVALERPLPVKTATVAPSRRLWGGRAST